ncbi:hypothetical protein [Flammeovirga kamogawensis]|uniref:DUF1735 domain-containing protein n=1 Tax=Flammeovirga kamogawensis TaxID=373891 RepID=A0ABX8GQT1_9BACT|nr:hypothetical protein [Flammeovirga kamogawensis]MBB6462039.1 hypothetical protein [Flammeovirga kamogawensis]QWG05774.1 hypothetical protein KM029_10310 [Flammeovirga kamogawensis]TRX67601.1 hypothetical protein EO216_05330 [Flammeovirga kamogawensis]
MKKIVNIWVLCIGLTFQSCELYDTYKDEVNAEFIGETVAFAVATPVGEADSVKENSVPLSLTVEMPMAIQTNRGIEIRYTFEGDAVFGTDFTAKAIERNEPNASDVTEKYATSQGGKFVIKNREVSEDEAGEESYTNTQNTATIEVSPLVVAGVDKTSGKSLSIVLSSAKNLDNGEPITVGQGGIKKEYNIIINDIHCPTSLAGTYGAQISTETGVQDVSDVTLTNVDALANPDDIWGLYDISNIAGDIQDIPFQIIDQCGEFLGPSDSYISVQGDTEANGRIVLDVMFSDGTTTKQWILYLTKK